MSVKSMMHIGKISLSRNGAVVQGKTNKLYKWKLHELHLNSPIDPSDDTVPPVSIEDIFTLKENLSSYKAKGYDNPADVFKYASATLL